MNSGYATIARIHAPRIPAKRAPSRLAAEVSPVHEIRRELRADSGIMVTGSGWAAMAQRIRRLKTSLLYRAEGPPQVIVVASPESGEGRSFVAMHLALAFADERPGQVLLIDADLRKPSLGNCVSPAPELGFSEVIEGKAELDHAVLSLVNSPLRILPAGTPPWEPEEFLMSNRTTAIMQSLRERFQTIIIDTPPILPFVDADIIGAQADGFLLVARSGMTARSTFLEAISRVTSKPILGRVLNGAAV